MWSYNEQKSVAYKISGQSIFLTSSIAYNKHGQPEVYGDENDDMEVFQFNIKEDGSLAFSDWIDLRQFNNSHSFLNLLSTLNDILAFKTGIMVNLSVKEELNKPSIFKVTNITHGWKTESLYDLEADLYIGEEKFSLSKQFVKYTFIKESICNRAWTVESLFNFYVHLQKFLYEQEVLAGKDMFLQVDPEVRDLLNGSSTK